MNENADVSLRNSYYLESGYIRFSKEPATIRTVVGSCVAVCLWDEEWKYGGMNHFIQPATRKPAEATPKFGNVAIVALLRIMEEAGCIRHNIVAQVVGGASDETNSKPSLGEENVNVAKRVLQRNGIRVVSEDIGGAMGRKLAFDTATGHLAVLKVQKIRQSDWR